MPLKRYFGLAFCALFAAAIFVASPSSTTTSGDLKDRNTARIRISSNMKWPERIVIDTSQPTLFPQPGLDALPPPPLPPDILAESPEREAFAQSTAADEKPAAAPARRQHPRRQIARLPPPAAAAPVVVPKPPPPRSAFAFLFW